MDLFKLVRGFVKSCFIFSGPLPNKTKLNFDQDFKDCWSFCFELKVFMSQSTQCLGSVVALAIFVWNMSIFTFTFWYLFLTYNLCMLLNFETSGLRGSCQKNYVFSLKKINFCSFDPMMHVLIFTFPFSIFVSHFHFLPAIKFCNKCCERRLPKNWQFEGGRQWSEPN